MAARTRRAREPTDEEIRERAYELYQQRGQEPGHEREDWDQARRELMARMTDSPARRSPQRGTSTGAQPSPTMAPARGSAAKKAPDAAGSARRPRGKGRS